MSGALRLAELAGASGILGSCRDYVREVLAGTREAPDHDVIDALADALSSVEYFIERLVIDGRPADLGGDTLSGPGSGRIIG